MSLKYKVSIIIPVLNKWELTKNCLVSLAEHTPREIYEVIVIDNGSTDKTPTMAKHFGLNLFGKHFKYIRLSKNINFGPACNLGAKIAKSDFLFFLNNDTILTPNWLEPLLKAFTQDPSLGAIGPLLLYPNNTVQHLGVVFSLRNKVFHLYSQFPKNHYVVQKKRYFQAITGAAFLIPKKLFWQLNGFFEKYKNGSEDIDLCARIIQNSHKLTVIPNSVIYHLESQSQDRNKHDNYNAYLLTKRCGHIFKPDAWKFYLQDGYKIKITKYLKLFITSDSQEKEIPQSIEKIKKIIFNEPYLWEGYKKLVTFYIKKNKFQEGIDLCYFALSFYPEEKILPWLSLFAQKQNNIQIIHEISTLQNKLKIQSTQIKEKGKEYVKKLLKKEPILEPWLLSWLKRYSIN
ncbi:glycosyltransferase family 2 protein [Desulfonauticus submarinus]